MTSSISEKTVNNLSSILLQFSQNYIEAYQKLYHQLPQIECDEQWRSPCEQQSISSQLDYNHVYWQPMEIHDKSLSFENIEEALNIEIHSDIASYFSTLFSESLNAKCDEGELSLLFAWNKDDFERLQENLIGHILMKQRLKQPITLFFAVTDDDDTNIVLDNGSGEVWVEHVGCKPHKKLTNSLGEFIETLTPVIK